MCEETNVGWITGVPLLALAEEMWADDVTKWPSIEFPDIVLYLIDTPGEEKPRVLRTTIIFC